MCYSCANVLQRIIALIDICNLMSEWVLGTQCGKAWTVYV